MYVYYQDKNDTIGCIELKNGMLSHQFEQPVFVFHIELNDKEKESEEANNQVYGLLGLNPYELACVSRNLNCCFEPQAHMFTLKTIRTYTRTKIEPKKREEDQNKPNERGGK